MNYYGEDFFLKLALPPVDCLWNGCVPLLFDVGVDIVFGVKTISHVIMFI
jgi:hypothetical protein